jgi:hypothetical protein
VIGPVPHLRLTASSSTASGPVIAVIPYETDDEAVAIANDSNYGLSGSV